MPLVKISILEGKSTERKKQISGAIHEAIKESLSVSDWDLNHRIIEFKKENWSLPEGNWEDKIIIEVDLFPGRTKEIKTACLRKTFEKLEGIGIAKDYVLMMIREPALENWFVCGKTAQEIING